jgi:hypothetical protein
MMPRRWSVLGAGVLALGGRAAVAQLPPDVPRIRIIGDPAPLTVLVDEHPDLPIVNSGFAGDKDLNGPIRSVVEALRSPVFAERESANLALLRLPPERLKDVVNALAVEDDAEAIERLTQVAAHLYLKPRTLLRSRASLLGVWFQQPGSGMLGVKFKMDPVKLKPEDTRPTMTVMVTEIQVGFPALQTLRNGDRIVAIGGIGFPPDTSQDDRQYFRSRIAALWPGGVATMTVLRDGRLLELGVQISGLPTNTPSSPTDMVDNRTAALNAFLQSLKIGDKSQARTSTLPSQDHGRLARVPQSTAVGPGTLLRITSRDPHA